MSLRVGIDVSGALNPASGIGRYTTELSRALHSGKDEAELVGFVNAFRGRDLPDLGFEIRNARWPERILKRSWTALRWPPIERFLGPLHVFHSSDWVQPPLATAAAVSTVHDLGALLHPEWYAPAVVRIHERKNRDVADRADLVIAISEYTRQTFREAFGFEHDRIHVVPNGVSATFRPASAAEMEDGLQRLSLPPRYLLYVGTRERRKNLLGLLDIFARVSAEDQGTTLVIVGARPWEEARAVHGVGAWTGRELEDEIGRRGLTTRVRILGRVSEEDLRVLYSGAECFAFPSLFEGFGLPVLEAMACGCPVVASDRSAVPEVVGNAGVVVDPDDGAGFAAALLSVMSDARLRDDLVVAGVARAAEFTWRRTASMTWDVYRAAAGRRGAPAART